MPSGKLKPLRKCAVSKSGWTSIQLALFQRLEIGALRIGQRPVDQFAGAHVEARMAGADALREIGDHLMVVAAFARRLDELPPEHDVLMATALIEVVMFEEHGGGQHDIGEFRRLGHELLVHADEEILARQTLLHLVLVGRDGSRVGVLDDHRLDRRAACEIVGIVQECRRRCGSGR